MYKAAEYIDLGVSLEPSVPPAKYIFLGGPNRSQPCVDDPSMGVITKEGAISQLLGICSTADVLCHRYASVRSSFGCLCDVNYLQSKVQQ